MADFNELLQTDEGEAFLAENGYVNRENINSLVDDEIKKRTDGLGIDGLKKKRDELLKKISDPDLKNAKEQNKQINELFARYGISEYNELETILDGIKNPNEPDDVRNLRRESTKLKSEFDLIKNNYEELTSKYQDTENFTKKILTVDKLRANLLAYGCNKYQAEAFANHIMGHAQFDIIINQNGGREAVTADGLTVDEFFTNWSGTPEAREILPAKTSIGGGASGGRGSGGVLTMEQIAQIPDRNERLQALQKRGVGIK